MEEPEIKPLTEHVDLRKELLIAAMFWICAIATGVLLAWVLKSWYRPADWQTGVLIDRDPLTVRLNERTEVKNGFDPQTRQWASVGLMAGTLLTGVAWLFHSRRFSLKTYIIVILIVAFVGLIPHIEMQSARSPIIHVFLRLSPEYTLNGQELVTMREKFSAEVARQEIPEELSKRLEGCKWSLITEDYDSIPKGEVAFRFVLSGKASPEDMESLATFYAQYADILVREYYEEPGKTIAPAKITALKSEWSRRWAPTFEAEYRARKAAAKGVAEKEEKVKGP